MPLATPLFAALLATASAAEPDRPAPATDPQTTSPEQASPMVEELDLEDAEPLGRLTQRKLQFLKPKRHRLPQNPYGSVDFTAYALEFGEWRVGLGSLSVGVAPRVQLGTMPVLDALGLYNVSAKANFLRVGPVNFAVGGSHYRLSMSDFLGTWTAGTGTLSVRVLDPWSLHVSGSYVDLQANGTPSLGSLQERILTEAAGDQLAQAPGAVQDRARQEVSQATTAVDARGQAVTLKVATDVRLNRRDSVVLQGQAMMWGRLNSDVNTDLPPILGLDEALDTATEETMPIAETYAASAAWQMQWKRLELRIGAGVSSVPGAWLLQSTDLAWRFGGKTRSSERRMRRAWRHDRKSLRRGADDAVAAADRPGPESEAGDR